MSDELQRVIDSLADQVLVLEPGFRVVQANQALLQALGRGMGLTLPKDEDFVIIAIEAEDVLTFGEECTPTVEAAIPRAVEAVLAELEGEK